MDFFFLIILMVICTSCQKQFKKAHGLSQHRNKCSKLRSEPVFKRNLLNQNLKAFQVQQAILKFKKKPEHKDLNGQEDEPVRIFLIQTQKNIIVIYSGNGRRAT
jgi:hypothetical protein